MGEHNMADWTFWEWIAYTTMLVAAIVLAADQGIKLAPEMTNYVPAFISSPLWAFAPLALLMIGTAILIGQGFGWFGHRLANRAELRLRSHGDHRVPTVVSENNVWRWYVIRNTFTVMDIGRTITDSITNIFINFDRPVKIGTIVVVRWTSLFHGMK
jgi:hypothetical protein